MAKIEGGKPRQQRLPGTEDAKLVDIHDAALRYRDVRDQRQGLTRQEVEAKGELLGLMKKHRKKTYSYNGVEVEVVVEKEKVRVKVRGEEDSEEEAEES